MKCLCKGKQITSADRDACIVNLQTALAASHGLKTKLDESANNPIHVGDSYNHCHVGDVNNIQVNINVLPFGEENIDHLKDLSLTELKDKIGLNPDASTMIELFKLVRLDAEHPENHNLLLTSNDTDRIHYFDKDGWKEGRYNDQIRMALLDDKIRLRDLIRFRNWDEKFYWGYLEHHVGQKINERDDVCLRPIFDGIRSPLLESTLKLAARHDENNIRLNKSTNHDDGSNRLMSNSDDIALAIEKEKSRQLADTCRKLELELEIMKLKMNTSA